VGRPALACILLLLATFVIAQTVSTPGALPPPQDYVCPMHPDVRSAAPGKCPRCGMILALGIPDPVEYPMDFTLTPRTPKPFQAVEFAFRVRDPKSAATVNRFEVIHEKLFHLFVVSQDLSFFLHDHPVIAKDGAFHYQGDLPKPGMYRVLADYYPAGATPQLTAKTFFVPGAGWQPAHPEPDLAPKHTANMDVEVSTDPAVPIAGMKTMIFFRLKPAEGLEPYLGAWAHMLAASDDLIDLIHTHPFVADGGPQMQFNIIFPRAHAYRMWVQMQRQGVVNTAVFTIPVSELK
jgi:hypothetical protein